MATATDVDISTLVDVDMVSSFWMGYDDTQAILSLSLLCCEKCQFVDNFMIKYHLCIF